MRGRNRNPGAPGGPTFWRSGDGSPGQGIAAAAVTSAPTISLFGYNDQALHLRVGAHKLGSFLHRLGKVRCQVSQEEVRIPPAFGREQMEWLVRFFLVGPAHGIAGTRSSPGQEGRGVILNIHHHRLLGEAVDPPKDRDGGTPAPPSSA